MLDILTIVHSFADIRTASRIRRTCRRLAALIPEPTVYINTASITKYKYRVGNKLHRLDGPARETYGHKSWYREGVAHREYHPQLTNEYCIVYKVNGVYHREADPSIVYSYTCDWYTRGMLHRKVGPATSYRSSWYTLKKLHRLDGPAYWNVYAIRGIRHSIFCTTASVWVVDGISIRE